MTDYTSPLRVSIPAQGTHPPPAGTFSPSLGTTVPHTASTASAGAASQLRAEQLKSLPERSSLRQSHSQPHILSRGTASHTLDPISVGGHNTSPVVPRHITGVPATMTTPPPGSLASPVHIKQVSPSSNALHSTGAKSTNFHNIADLIGGSKSHYHQFHPEAKSPGRIPQYSSGCIKQQTTPTSSPRLGDQSDEYIDVVEDPAATSPGSNYSADVTSPEGKAKESSPTNPDNNRTRKGRTIYKAQQVYVLEEIFRRTHYPDPEVIETLSRDLDISENKIKVWFQNKRARWRRRAAETGHPVMPPIGYNPMAPATGIPGWPHGPPGGLHVHTSSPAGSLLVPQPIYPGLQGSPHIPISQPPTPLSMLPQLQSLYSMDPGLMSLKTGLHNFPPLQGINLSMLHMWPESSKLTANSS